MLINDEHSALSIVLWPFRWDP